VSATNSTEQLDESEETKAWSMPKISFSSWRTFKLPYTTVKWSYGQHRFYQSSIRPHFAFVTDSYSHPTYCTSAKSYAGVWTDGSYKYIMAAKGYISTLPWT